MLTKHSKQSLVRLAAHWGLVAPQCFSAFNLMIYPQITTHNGCLSKTAVRWFHPPACHATVCHVTVIRQHSVLVSFNRILSALALLYILAGWLKMEAFLILPSPLSLPHITVEFVAMPVQVDARW